MKKLTLLVATFVAMVAMVAAFAQTQPAINDGVDTDTTMVAPPLPNYYAYINSADPALYGILVNGWIMSYAKVTIYDNWINFDQDELTPRTGDVQPWRVIASGNANANLPAGLVNEGFDLAGLRVETNCRLNLYIGMGGHLTRCEADGTTFAGSDTRRNDNDAPYQLATQYKIAFKGLFFPLVDSTDPAQDAYLANGSNSGTLAAFVSPTSSEDTFYAAVGTDYTKWNPTDNVIGGGSNVDNSTAHTDEGWLWPVGSTTNFPWTGSAYTATDVPSAPYDFVPEYNLVIERGQAEKTLTAASDYKLGAEFWIAESVWRRGLQDVMGNYRQDITVELSYRESDNEWDATVGTAAP